MVYKYICKHCGQENIIDMTREEIENNYDFSCDYCGKQMTAEEIDNEG